jgi:hypothetical protein
MGDNMATIAAKLQGLPIEELISAPLRAACDAQKDLANSTYEFINQVGLDENNAPRLITFDLDRPILGTGETSKVRVNAPFLGLVPIPSLLIDDVKIDFQMEITDTVQEKKKKDTDASINGEASFNKLIAKASVTVAGKVTSARENTRSTNQTAKYQVSITARQQAPTEGLSKLMDLLAASIEPIHK